MSASPNSRAGLVPRVLPAILALAALMPASFARAQGTPVGEVTSLGRPLAANSLTGSQALRAVAGFFSVGGYYYTSASASRALGTPKFYGDTQIFARPKNFGIVNLTGGLEVVSANDHFFPFQGGNEFTLIGPAFKVSTTRAVNRIQPFVSGGLFLGRVRAVRATPGFDRSNFVPSLSVGVEYPLRYVTLYASYRINHEIHSVNTDGFSVGIRLF